ncbi:MAG TPA: phosphoglycerate dehydrogenase [Burkholderiales bacterium]|nr:phosphoglycerate dehydrogenase [Burkholderiales bacterium]
MANAHYKILTLNQISPVGLKRFPASRFTVGTQVADPDAILVRSADLHKVEIPATVKAIGRAGAGTNNIPVPQMTARGVPVFNTPGANANAVKELVLAGIFLAARNLIPALRFTEGLSGDDATLHKLVEDGKKQFAGIELPGRHLGVIGLGAVGRLVADAAIKLGMKVTGFDPEITVDAAWSLPNEVRRAHSIEELLRASDFVTLHVPLLEVTRGLVDAKRVHAMRHGAVLLNFSRDKVVDEDAVLAGIEEKRIRYYVCDFPSARLQGHPGVVTLPHLGASTEEAETNCAVMVSDQIRDFLEHGNILNTVNFPNVYMERESPFRTAIANANVPNMVGQISSLMGRSGLNIHNMVNKSRGDMAYTLLDTDSAPSAEVLGQIGSIPGVLVVRSLPSDAQG